ncbi:hypothetical protein SFRURICE_001929 [Spodoptera frugiperda]|nr:hypothetical protein SFRURICE_001929 [Spodoptera frugiperda]
MKTVEYPSHQPASLVEWSQVDKGFGFDSRVGQIARSLELCPVYGNRLTPYNKGTYNRNGEKWVYLHCIVALRVVMSTYPFGDKSGRKCDCWTRGHGFDSRVGQSITELLSLFWARSLKVCPVYGNCLTPYYTGQN